MIDRRICENFNPDDSKIRGKYILYWMHSCQRIRQNYSFIKAISLANKRNIPLKVFFNINKAFEWGNYRNYTFMIQGIKDIANKFYKMGINFHVHVGDLESNIKPYIDECSEMVLDKTYIKKVEKTVYSKIKNKCKNRSIGYTIIDCNTSVPIHLVSPKLEYSARTIRPKVWNQIEDFKVDYKTPHVENKENQVSLSHIYDKDIFSILKKCDIDVSVKETKFFQGGEANAKDALDKFLKNKIHKYEDDEPGNSFSSKISMYLHFGHISPIEILLACENLRTKELDNIIDAFLEQLIVRRALSYNFVNYMKNPDTFEDMTHGWAYETMKKHLGDPREYIYTQEDYLNLKTHDEYFNAAMKEMIITGYMHNYMRMYWAKKVIEWSKTYKDAYEIIKNLNNTYFLDGRDPISYASIAWCFGRHDRAWSERPVFGKLRYMNANGLKRKFDIKKYIEMAKRDFKS